MPTSPPAFDPTSPLDRARRKALFRLVPLLFLCYVIAYVDRNNVGLAALTMPNELPHFTKSVIGFGAGMFFIGYFMLEIPGTLLVEKWSARKWICRIMVTWGIVAAAMALVKTEGQFYLARFFLGLAEAGFFPGVIVYLTHWFPRRDRAKALAWFMIGTPIAQLISPKISYPLLRIGTVEPLPGSELVALPNLNGIGDALAGVALKTGALSEVHPYIWGMAGWQWMYIFWGIPAVVLGIVVLFFLTDWPREAKWLTTEERQALEAELKKERAEFAPTKHLSWASALKEPKVLLLAAAYFFVVTGNYAVETFLPSIFKDWYSLDLNNVTWLLMLPPLGSLAGQLLVGWSSDKTKERRLHACIPIYAAMVALIVLQIVGRPDLWLTVVVFIVVATGLKAYLPAFWSLPSLFLVEAAAASSIGFINSVGNLGGFAGPYLLGFLKDQTGSYLPGLLYLCFSLGISATIILTLGLGRKDVPATAAKPAMSEL